MWRFSRAEIAKGALDTLGEQTFTDGKVRKALDAIMAAAPRSFLNAVREATGDQTITPQQVKASLARIWRGSAADPQIPGGGHRVPHKSPGDRSQAAKKVWRTRRAADTTSPFDEAHHIADKPREVIELYRALDRICTSMHPGQVTKRFLAKYIAYNYAKHAFCTVHLQQAGLRVWLKLKYNRVANPPSFARDVSGVGHWGTGDFEMAISNQSQLHEVEPLVRQSLDETGR